MTIKIAINGCGRIGRCVLRALVEADAHGNDVVAIDFAAAQTSATENGMVRVVSWYDNEWGFSNRMLDMGREIGRHLNATAQKMAS